jgi:beta-lactamase regulating signal transducer with metallopeptidase domain
MLENIFIAVLNMSITASIAAVLITFIRWIFGRRLPKIFGYTLWVIVLLRLFIPFFIPSMFSVFNLIPMPQTSMAQSQHYYETKGTIPYSMNDGNTSVEITAADALSNKINSSLPLPVPEASVDLLQVLTFTVSWIWLVGTAGLLLFSLFAYFHTRNKLKTAVLYKCGSLISQCSQKIKLKRKIKIYTSDWVQTPIVCGLTQPCIILPVIFERDLSESEIKHIITHELVHIKRFDYLIKPLSVLALCIHWFNPIIWVSFILSQKDMEMSCDEKVISVFGHDIRNEYATSLIRLAVKQNRILNCGLLAFGESNIKSRIKGIMNFKKLGFWLGTVAIVFLIALGAMLLTNGQFDDPIVNEELRVVIPDTLEVTRTLSTYKQGHIVEVEGRFKSQDGELYLTFIANDAKGGGQLEDGIRKADEIEPLNDGWFSFRHKLIETTGEVTYTKNLTIVFHLKRDGKNDKGLLTVAAKQPPGSSPEPEDESGDTNNNDRDNKGWEVIGARADRVQGTITELDITDGMLSSVTLIGTKRIKLPNNPIDYDFAGQTFNIEFNEELTKAGNLKDKLKKGTEIVVTFAQYAIPPNGKYPGKTILGAYLSEIYCVENGKYYDIQGKEVDLLPSSAEAATEISSIRLIQSDGRSSIEAELYCGKNITLHIGTLEVIVKTGIDDLDINALKNRYSLIDVGNGIIAVVEKVNSARGECIVLDFYEYNDEHIRKVWSSSDLSAQIQNINEDQFELYFPKFDFGHKLQFTKDELNYWEQKAAELRDNNVKIDDSYYLDIKENLLIDAIAYHITNLNDTGKKEVMILSEVRTVGAKTPYIRDRVVIIIKNNNGVISMEDIVFERESTKGETPFVYFS